MPLVFIILFIMMDARDGGHRTETYCKLCIAVFGLLFLIVMAVVFA